MIVLRDGEIVENRPAAGLNIKQIAGWMMGKSNREAYVDDDKRKIDENDIIFEAQNLYVEMPGEMAVSYTHLTLPTN